MNKNQALANIVVPYSHCSIHNSHCGVKIRSDISILYFEMFMVLRNQNSLDLFTNVTLDHKTIHK